MGGDHAPSAPVGGALLALQELDAAHSIQLVGRESVVRAELDRQLAGDFGGLRDVVAARLSIVHADEVIEMTDKPSVAIRGKPNSSMAVGLRLQPEGKSEAFVSAGNTGAQMAASTFILRLHDGLTRPAISTLFPTVSHPLVVLDSGANVDCSAQELVSFARLGSVYAADILGRQNPSVGLLSIGEEAEKGNAVVKEAHQLLRAAEGINFQGNIEGRDLPLAASERGPIDVVVCDGFTGNVLLKFLESVGSVLLDVIKVELPRGRRGKVGSAFLINNLRRIKKRLDHAEHGGALLLGVDGICVIGHGSSKALSVVSALRLAHSAASHGVMEDLHALEIESREPAAAPAAGSITA